MILEAGEVSKVEPAIVETTVRGVRNVLAHLNMIPDPVQRPPFQIVIETTKWVRAQRGGFLQFHVSPGEIVDRGKPLATHTSLLGRELDVLKAPFHGVVLGMTTLPAISPGEPVCCLGKLVNGTPDILQIRRSLGSQHLHERVIEDLATRFVIVNRDLPERRRAAGVWRRDDRVVAVNLVHPRVKLVGVWPGRRRDSTASEPSRFFLHQTPMFGREIGVPLTFEQFSQ